MGEARAWACRSAESESGGRSRRWKSESRALTHRGVIDIDRDFGGMWRRMGMLLQEILSPRRRASFGDPGGVVTVGYGSLDSRWKI